MSDHDPINGQDRPVEREDADALDRGPFVGSLVRALVADERDVAGKLVARRATGFIVGLTGRWGLGKSSILNLLALKLGSMERVLVATFNPWLFSGRDELLKGFFNELRVTMGRSGLEQGRELTAALDRYWGAIDVAGHVVAAGIDLHGGTGTATTFWSSWGDRFRKALPKQEILSAQDERRSLELKLKKSKLAVVVLIDELDRVEDADVRAVAQLVKAVGDIKGISYLVAYDPDRVADALGRGEGAVRKQSGAHYLEKIIQHPIPLRPLFRDDVEALLKASLRHHGVSLPEPDSDDDVKIFDCLKEAITTPRDVKRLIGAFAVLEAAVRDEISPFDVLSYAWLLTKAPAVRDAIAADFDKVVSDPSESEMVARLTGRMDDKRHIPTPAEILGENATPHSQLLTLMFPRFGEDRERDRDGFRLSRRRNLVRLLYLGDPPGMIKRSVIERLWDLPDISSTERELRQLHRQKALPLLIDRLDDLLPKLPAAGDTIFWPALSRVLTRQTDWITGPEAEHALADDAATTLTRLGFRDPSNVVRVKSIIAALLADNDLVFVPWILRKHMFIHGLTRHGDPRNGPEIFRKEETIELLEQELPRYRAAVLDGTALRRLPNVEAIYVISNREEWDATLRAAFTEQLKGVEALSTLAGLMVPPGHGGERKVLNELFDASAVLAEIQSLADRPAVLEPWLAASLRRLEQILSGSDPFA